MNYLKEWLIRRKKIVSYVQEHFEELKLVADNSKCVKYSTQVSGIGCFSPSLVNHIIHSSYRKGRLLKNKPDSTNYTEFTLDNNGKPLRLRDMNKFGCDLTAYFYSDNEYTYSVPLFKETKNDYGKKVFAYKIDNDRVIEYAEIEDSYLYLELYTYPDNNGIVICEMFEYLDFSIAYSMQSKEETERQKIFFDFLANNAIGKSNRISQEVSVPSSQTKPKLSKFKYFIRYENNKILSVEEFYCKNDNWQPTGFAYVKK